MKRIYLVAFLLFCGVATCLAQENCNIIEEYGNIFQIKRTGEEGDIYLKRSVKKMPQEACFADLVNNNSEYIGYLRLHFSDVAYPHDLVDIKDSVRLQKEYIALLQKDSTFNSVMLPLAKKAIELEKFVPDTVEMKDIMNIAVKFFDISKIQNGYYVAKICAGLNGIKATELQRKPQIEAFCFQAVMGDVLKPEFKVYDEFVKVIKDIYQLNLGTNEEERLLRAQGAAYLAMKNNEKLQELIQKRYNEQKQFLPFILINN